MRVDKLFGAVSLCRRAGKLIAGHDAVCDAVHAGNAALVLLASDASPRTMRNIKAACEGLCEVKTLPHTKADLAVITHKPAGVLAVADRDLAVLCRKAMPDEEEPV